MKIIPFLFCCFLAFRTFACMNEFDIIPGITVRKDINDWEMSKPDVSKSQLRITIGAMERKCGAAPSEKCSDLVIAYCYMGEYEKAVALSTLLAEKYPEVYQVIMTHAAALELNGRFREALRFVKKGIAIDSASHQFSEWIHVKILEDRLHPSKGSVLGFDFGKGAEPVMPENMPGHPRSVLKQLHFQLIERWYFIPKDDEQFGRLLYDYANLLYLNNFKTISREYYAMAEEYGFVAQDGPSLKTLPPLPEKHVEGSPDAQTILKFSRRKPSASMFPYVFMATVAGIVLGGFALASLRKNRK